jgi:hypothetical protein
MMYYLWDSYDLCVEWEETTSVLFPTVDTQTAERACCLVTCLYLLFVSIFQILKFWGLIIQG